MLEITIPGGRTLRLQHLVFDVNGTLALDGELLPGVAERLARLRDHVEIHLLTADTHGRQKAIDDQLGLQATILGPSESTQQARKADYVYSLGAHAVAAIGNGNNDAMMLRAAALGIAILGPEGLATTALTNADILCRNIHDALDLLLKPNRLRATLRV